MYDEKFDESAALAELFNYKTAKLSSSTKYICEFEHLLLQQKKYPYEDVLKV